jgi:hypothetical protein
MAKKVNGKQKGNSFERKIANTFSERFTEHTGITQSFRRNPDSGSFFGGTNISRAETHDTDWALYGDLICPKAFNFSVECKHYKAAPKLNGILKQKLSEWDGWIAQAQQDAKASEKDVLIIIRYNNTETLVMTEPGVSPLIPIITYESVVIQTLENLLELPDSFFFSEK